MTGLIIHGPKATLIEVRRRYGITLDHKLLVELDNAILASSN